MTTTAFEPAPTRPQDLVDSARGLRPLIESHRDEMETQRHMPQSLVQALIDARLFYLYTPKAIGGLEVDPITAASVIEEVSRVDGSAGWNLMIGAGGGFLAAYYSEAAAREMFSPENVVAGALAPTGKAVVVDGGYKVTGRWGFGSGIHHAAWAGGNCIVFDGEAPRMAPQGMPAIVLAMAPIAECEVHDVWHVSGLRGTGSEDFSMTDLFVPDERAASPFFTEPAQATTLSRMPITFFMAQIAIVPLGIARGAIDSLVELATTKVPMRFGSVAPLRDRPMAQATVARAEALLGSARAYFYEALGELWETVKAGDEPGMEQRTKLRLATLNAATASAQAVDLVYNAGGGTSIYERSLLQRCFRDVHAATQHVAVAPDGMETAGRVLFGLEPGTPLF